MYYTSTSNRVVEAGNPGELNLFSRSLRCEVVVKVRDKQHEDMTMTN